MSLYTAEEIRRYHAEYHPLADGVHVFQPEGGEFGGITLRNFPGADLEIFRQYSSAGEGDDWDLLCDLMSGEDLIDTIPIRRQDLELIERALSERSSK